MMRHMTPTSPALLTVPEAAAELRVDPATVRRWITIGRLPASKPGRDYRIRAEHVAQLLTGELTTTTALTSEDVAATTRAQLTAVQPATTALRARLAQGTA